MTEIAIVYTTFMNEDDAGEVLSKLIEEGHAKCGNIGAPHVAIYPWKGHVAREQEVAVLIKTTTDRVEKLKDELRARHTYELPCIMSWTADAIPEYAAWLAVRD